MVRTLTLATLVTLAWVAYDLAVLGVLVPAARYSGPRPPREPVPETTMTGRRTEDQ